LETVKLVICRVPVCSDDFCRLRRGNIAGKTLQNFINLRLGNSPEFIWHILDFSIDLIV